jgi:hypothetical protein
MRYSVCRYFSLIAVFLCLVIMDGCGSDSDSDLNLAEGWKWQTTEQVIGPEGGTVEVTDSNSTLYGVKVEIPAGALAQETNIVIQDKWFASLLPAGVTSSYPIVEFSPETTFLKNIQITFPIQSIPSGDDGIILSAFYWNSAKGKWIVVFPQQVNDSKMTIKTDKFGLFEWGLVSLTEVEPETVTAWMEDMFEAWGDLQKAILDKLLDPWKLVIEDPQNLLYCDTQDSIMSQLSFIRDVARQRVADYLATNNVLNECQICTYHYPIFDENPDCVPSVCDPTELITGQPGLWAVKEYQIFIERIWVEGCAAVLPYIPSELVGVYVAEARYLQAAKALHCDWRCMLLKGDIEFYVDLLLGNACSFSILAIEFYRSQEGCIIR